MLDNMFEVNEVKKGLVKDCVLFKICPEAAGTWDYTRNTIKPEDVTPSSTKRVFWLCAKGHSFERPVRVFVQSRICPECRRLSTTVSGKSHMMRFWDFEKNTGNVTQISAKSTDIANWKCKKCGYEWQSTIRCRKNDLCPCCDTNSVIIKGVNDFATVYPRLGLDALQEMNPDIDLGKEGVGSHKRIMWRCHVCGYEWTAPIYGRIRRDTPEYRIAKCPVCARNRRMLSFDQEFPELIELYSKNNLKALSDIDIDWQQKYIWVCDIHGEFTAVLSSMIRAIRTDNNGCPYCNGTKVKREESFGALHPDLVSEWSPKNEISPFEITENSKREVEWVCHKGHTWVSRVATRSKGYGFCRDCFPFGKAIKSFADVHSDLRKHYSNKNLTPFNIHSQREYTHAIWICDEGHEFNDTFLAIDRRGFRCPVCSGREIVSGYNDFKTLYPEYARDYDEVKNALPANKISPKSSDMGTWWRCEKGHSYHRSVRSHIVWRGVCPVCSRHVFVAGVNDLLTAYPRIADIWDYDRNGRGPEEVYDSNPNYHAFICNKGHHYSAKIQQVADNDFSCLICDNIKFDGSINSLAVLKPELAKEWSPNNARGVDTVRPTYRMSALWICPNCKGEYRAAIADRDIGDELCPFCADKKILVGLNDLRTTHPDLVSEWSSNNVKGPEQYWKKSQEYVKWVCHVCHGEYSAIIKNREFNDNACPYCNRSKLLTGFNDLLTTNKQLASEWSPDNERTPDTVCHTYWLTVKWICPDCGGEYFAPIKDREVGDDACPYCNSNIVLPGNNDLLTVYPALAAEWSPSNERNPDSVCRDFKEKVRWICPDCGGEYSAKIAEREVGDEACPYCNRGNLLAGLNDLATTDPGLAKEWSRNNDKPASSVRRNYVYRALWICTDCGNDYRASVCDREIDDKLCPYCYGSRVLTGYNDLATVNPLLAEEWSPNNDRTSDKVRIDRISDGLWVCPTCHGEYSARIVDREVGDEACPYCANKATLVGYNDLSTVDPTLAEEWSPNNVRAIDEVRINQKFYVLWICPTCHGEYSARIDDREVGDGACPYCANKATLAGYNDLATADPALAKEWSQNNDKPVSSVRRNSVYRVLWVCPDCGGEYSAIIANREVGDEACPYCANKATLAGYNDLATVDPALAEEWSSNNDRATGEVRRNQNLYGLWICPICHGEYSAKIANREVGDKECPYCANKKALPGFNSFMIKHKDIMDEWLEAENLLIGIDPDTVLDNDRSSVWWQCKDCGKKYLLSIYVRLLKQKRGHSPCPFCNGRRIKLVHYI